MSVRTDVVNLQINVSGNKAQAELGTLRKKAADISFEMKGLKKGTEEYTKKATELTQVTARMDALKKSIGLASLSIKELVAEQAKFKRLQSTATIGSKEFLEYDKQLKAVTDRLAQVRSGSQATAGSINQVGGWLKGAGIGLAAAGIAAVGAAAGEFLSQSIDEFNEANRIAKELKNTLDNMGKGGSFDRITADAQELADAIGFVDNDDLNKASQQLLTYGKLTEKQIRDMLPVITDFSVKAGVGIPEATEKLIGALEGQGKALKQYGISIKDGGSVTERFGIIMNDLAPKVKGAAAAFGDTEEGAAAKELQKFKNLQEEVGGEVGPIWTKIKTSILEGVSGIIGGLKNLYNESKAMFDFYFRPGKFAADAIKASFDNSQKLAIDSARSFVKSMAGASEAELQKVLKQQQQLLLADEKAYKEQRSASNRQRLLDSAQIVLALKQEIDLRKEKIEIADKREPTAEEKATAKAEEEYRKRLADINAFVAKVSKHGASINQDAMQLIDVPVQINPVFEMDPERVRRALQEQADQLQKSALEGLGKRKAGLQLKTEVTQGREQLDATLKLLETEKAERIILAEQTGEEVEDIEKRYRNAKIMAVIANFTAEIDQYLQYSQAVLNIFQAIDDGKRQKEEQELNRLKKQTDAKKKIEDGRLKAGLISQAQYNKKTAELDEQLEKKQKELAIRQFNRNKKMQIAQAIISIAQAVLAALASGPPPYNFILAGLVGIAGGIQLKNISESKPPEAKRGLVIPGNTRHSDGGIDLYDRKQKRVIANVESGEPLWVFSRETYRNNKPVLDRLMYNSQKRSGASILPDFSGAYQPINTGRLVPMLQSGGVVATGSGAASNQAAAETSNATLVAIYAEMAGLRNELNGWQRNLKASVSLYDIKDQENQLQQARDASSLNQ